MRSPHPTDSRGANCCAEIRDILGCDPAGPCLGFAGDCGDYQTQFAELQGPFLYSDGPGEPMTEHDSLADWVCHAFPDDAYVTDQFFVGLISVAVALPVDMLLVRLFEASNEGDAPEQWLEAPSGVWKLLLGKDCHKAWRYDDGVSDLVQWLARRGAGRRPPRCCACAGGWPPKCGPSAARAATAATATTAAATTATSPRKAQSSTRRARARRRRPSASTPSRASSAFTSSGRPSPGSSSYVPVPRGLRVLLFLTQPHSLTRPVVPPQTYGMLIYRQLGDKAQEEFAKTWGVGYALNNASEWQDVLKTAAQTALVLVILDMLRVTKDTPWFEEHVDFVSMQAALLNGAARGWWSQTRRLVALQNRLTDD